jgi:hypothetical protein
MPTLVGEALQRPRAFLWSHALEGLQVAGGQPGRIRPWVPFLVAPSR